MKIRLMLGSLILLVSAAVYAQDNPTMSAHTGFSPGDTFTLFITFQQPMMDVSGIGCAFNSTEPAKPQQSDFSTRIDCDGTVQREDDKNYRSRVHIPDSLASGEYKISGISVLVRGVWHNYSGDNLPALGSVTIKNPKDNPKFSTIETLKVQ